MLTLSFTVKLRRITRCTLAAVPCRHSTGNGIIQQRGGQPCGPTRGRPGRQGPTASQYKCRARYHVTGLICRRSTAQIPSGKETQLSKTESRHGYTRLLTCLAMLDYATPSPPPPPVFSSLASKLGKTLFKCQFSNFWHVWVSRPQGRGSELNLACSTISVLFVCSYLAESARVKHLSSQSCESRRQTNSMCSRPRFREI
jgi:hypothetical protein